MASLAEDLDLDDEELIETSKKQKYLSKMREMGLLKYGKTITTEDLEQILNRKQKIVGYELWVFLELQIREIIKSEGFFITSRGKSKKLYILKPEEMAKYNENKNKTIYRNLLQRQKSLYMINAQLLSHNEQKKLEFEQMRNGAFLGEMSTKIRKRCSFQNKESDI